MKSSFLRKIIIGTFLSVPVISSVISTIHLIDLFNLGNPTWLSILLAVTFELGSIASLLAISVIDRIKVGAIWFIFFVLSGLQIIGNVYYSYSFTSDQLMSNPMFLTNFMDLFSFITGDDLRDVKVFLSCIIGIPIPLIALFFLKSNIDYLRPEKKNEEIPQLPSVEGGVHQTPVDPIQQDTRPLSEEIKQTLSAPSFQDDAISNEADEEVEAFPVQQEQAEESVSEPLVEKELRQEQEISDEEDVTIKRNRQNSQAPRYVFDERGVKMYNS